MAKTKKLDDTPDAETADGEEAPVRAELPEAPVTDTDAEFATDWHRDAYIDGLTREIEGGKGRVKELATANAHPDAIAAAKSAVDNARAELSRLTKTAD